MGEQQNHVGNRPLNRVGNPNLQYEKKPGPITKEGKFKCIIGSNKFLPNSTSKLLKHFRKCNNCPLRPKVVETYDKNSGEKVNVSIPGKCQSYEQDGKCPVKQDDYVKKIQLYYKIGEKLDTIALQNKLTYDMLENAEIAKETEMLKNRQPGFYASKFQELASKNLDSVNKLKFGETHKNLNVNVDLTDTIVSAYKERKQKNEEKGNTH